MFQLLFAGAACCVGFYWFEVAGLELLEGAIADAACEGFDWDDCCLET